MSVSIESIKLSTESVSHRIIVWCKLSYWPRSLLIRVSEYRQAQKSKKEKKQNQDQSGQDSSMKSQDEEDEDGEDVDVIMEDDTAS